MLDGKKENIEVYSKKVENRSRPRWGEQWDNEIMDYLETKGPSSLFTQMLESKAEEPCLVLGLASEQETLSTFYEKIIGVNIAIEEFQQMKKEVTDYDLVVCDAENLPFKDSSFKNVVSKAFLHHVDPVKELYEINRILCYDGFLYLWEPGKFNPIAAIGRKFFPTNIHVKSEHPFNPSTLKKLVKMNLGEIQYEGYYQIISLVLPILARHFKFFKSKKLADIADKIDRMLVLIGFKNLSWITVLGAKKTQNSALLNY